MNSEKQNLRPVFADQVNTMVNLLKPYMPSTETYKNSDGGIVNPTRNSDGSISLSGETLDSGITILAGTAYLRSGKSYCLCGTPGQGVKLQIIIDGKTYIDNGTGTTFSVISGGYFDVNVVVDPHTQIDKLTIYPIVTRNMQAKFGDFVPYISNTDQLNAQVAELSARLMPCDFGQGVDLENAYEGKPFTFPNDGYIRLYSSSNSSAFVRIFGSSGSSDSSDYAQINVNGTATTNDMNSIYVRKGMKCYYQRVTGTGNAKFIPLI